MASQRSPTFSLGSTPRPREGVRCSGPINCRRALVKASVGLVPVKFWNFGGALTKGWGGGGLCRA